MNWKKYTLEELADAFIFPVTLTPEQQKEAAEQLAAARKKSQAEMTYEQGLRLDLLQIRFHLENYIEDKIYDPEKNFGHFLKRYIDTLNIKRKSFAEDISIDETMLSQLINSHRLPPDYIFIRLELHADNLIPAEFWYRLVEKQRAHQIRTDKKWRRTEKKFVLRPAVKPDKKTSTRRRKEQTAPIPSV